MRRAKIRDGHTATSALADGADVFARLAAGRTSRPLGTTAREKFAGTHAAVTATRTHLVWQNLATGERSIWVMNGATWAGQYALLPTVPAEWRIVGVADDLFQRRALVWGDEFEGPPNAPVDPGRWLYDVGTRYPGGPAQWGTGEVETMTRDAANVSLDGAGHLRITPVNTPGGWTSGRIETQRSDFQAPPGGVLAVEAAIRQPNVTPTNGLGYWPAFWMLGAPFRGNYQNWPGVGEIDVMENVNALGAVFSTFHCGTSPGGPCNETTGLGSGQRPCAGCLASLHVYRFEWDRGVSPEALRWYLDGVNYFTVRQNQVDAATWANATNHRFMIILDVAMGGGFPGAFGGGPDANTVSGVPMVVDYARVYQR